MNILFPTDKRRDVQESCGKDDGAAESVGASPPNSRFGHGPDFAAGIHPRHSLCDTERHALSDGNSAVMDTQRSHDHNLSLTTNSTPFGCGEQVEETSRSPACSEVNSASEGRTAGEELISLPFGGWEEIMKGAKIMEQNRKKYRKSEEEGEGEEDEKVEGPRCEHYSRRCYSRVRFPCCSQFYPCHRCHNRSTTCKNDDAEECHATHLKCSICKFEQEVSFCLLSLRVHVTVGSLRNDHGNGGDSASIESYDWLNQEK